MSDYTYSKRSIGPVVAEVGRCDGCGDCKPIVMEMSGWGRYCSSCSKDVIRRWMEAVKGPRRQTVEGPPLQLDG